MERDILRITTLANEERIGVSLYSFNADSDNHEDINGKNILNTLVSL